MSNKRSHISLKHWQIVTILLVLYDLLAVNLSYFAALWLRFDCHYTQIPHDYFAAWLKYIPIHSAVCLATFMALRLYRSIWRFASYKELMRVIMSSAITGVLHIIGITLLFRRMPISYYVVGSAMQFAFVVAIRFSYRFVLLLRKNRYDEAYNRVMLIGAGAAGQMILRDINNSNESGEKVVCIIDDNPNKWERYIDGVPVVGGRHMIPEKAREYGVSKIYFAVPSATPEERKSILEICNETDCELKQLPGMLQFVKGNVTVSSMKDVSVEDLLGRAPIRPDLEEVYRFINGKVVLVTGGGGSIGSELCRQIAAHSPKRLIIFDVYENNAYSIQLELQKKHPELDLVTLIGSVRDSRKLFKLFSTYRPDIVYHAAAHKHVPLMEDSPCEAIKNNAIGTYKTAYAAMVHGCSRFVLISTDKAVNPTNIMGASKRLCEMIIQSFDAMIKAGRADEIPQLFTHSCGDKKFVPDPSQIKTEFAAVRFGNVLGSNGSVIPLFKKQIAEGGPVTVTHPDIIRYFMTIPEAVSLVMLAGVNAKGGEIFVLDMGSPVKIDTLARNLIKLSGYKPDVDIRIEYTGLRPGEKLYEEKLMAEEGLKKTDNDLIHIGMPIPFDTDTFLDGLRTLMDAAYSNDPNICTLVEEMVSTYHPENASSADAVYMSQLKDIEDDEN